MKLHEVTKNEDGTITIETELTPEETKALLQLGVMTCVQNGVMVASLAHYFGGEVEGEEEGSEVAIEQDPAEWQDILNRADDFADVEIIEDKSNTNNKE